MENLDVRIYVEKSGLKYQAIAKEMGISPEWLCRLMKKPLSPDNLLRVMKAVESLTKGSDRHEV